MKLKNIIKPIYIILFPVLYSCSPKLISTTQPLPQLVTSTLPGSEITLQPNEIVQLSFKTEPLLFFTPNIEITEDFTNFEKNQVRVKDEKLFENRKELLLDLEQLSANAFVFPLHHAKVISPYGTRRGRSHSGIDLKTFANDTVVAAFDGIVRVSNRGRGYGNVIVIRHYNGIETVYSHNSKNFVHSGDKVTAGTPIALTGRTGRATTEHVHFEARINGQHFDPNLLIDFQNYKLRNTCIVFTPSANGKIQIDQV